MVKKVGRPKGSKNKNSVPEATRFWSKVDKTGACWIWTAGCLTNGYPYGLFRRTNKSKASMQLAHRVSWELAFGTIPAHMNVLHVCDNPKCVNPAHLFLGSQQDNVDDCMRKGRHKPPKKLKGSANPMAKLSEYEVRAIKKLTRSGEQHAEIGKLYGISAGYVGKIHREEIWSHV